MFFHNADEVPEPPQLKAAPELSVQAEQSRFSSSTRWATAWRSSIGVDVPPVIPTMRAPSNTAGSAPPYQRKTRSAPATPQ